jgi:hypothetical protein
VTLPGTPHRFAFLGLLFASAVFGGIREDTEFSILQAEFGSSLPDGSNLKIAQIEYVRDGAWAPEAVDELASKVISYSPRQPASFSEHGFEVGQLFYGSVGSFIPAVQQIHAFEAWNYFDSSLRAGRGVAPLTAGWDVENHSYIANSGPANDEGNRRLDFRIDRDGVTATVVLANGSGAVPVLFAHSYNAIVVGLATGNHSRGGTTRNTAGRLKPDIVSSAEATSHAGPIAGSAAGLLIAKAKDDASLSSARRPEVIKAILMAGATKDEFPSWSRTATAPLDPIHGAGEVNVNNSYRILIAGRQPASSSTIGSNRGWDLNAAHTGSSQRYFFKIDPGQTGTVSAVLAWNREIAPNNGKWNQGESASLANYDLRLYRSNAQFAKGDLLQDSMSSIDNVEHVFLNNVAEGTYMLEVTSVSGSKPFGIAWTVLGADAGSSLAPQPVAAATRADPQSSPSATAAPIAQNSRADESAAPSTISGVQDEQAKSSDDVFAEPSLSAGTDGKLVNISSRSEVGTGSDVLISGFVVSGTAPKRLLIRGVGPSLSRFDLTGLLQRPKLEIYSGSKRLVEAGAGARIPSAAAARSAGQSSGAFALPDSSSDAVVVRSFNPGAYTVMVSGEDGRTGKAIVEVYDLDDSNPASRVVNLSTRSLVRRDSGILISGIHIGGSSPRRILFRAVGPGLKPLNVENRLARPKIALYKGATKLLENTGWNLADDADEVAAVSNRFGAFALNPTSVDSALVVTLAPGSYTLHVSGADGGTGVVLADVFDAGPGNTSTDRVLGGGPEISKKDRSAETRNRKIFGHYMGSFAAGSGAIQYHATTGIESMNPPANILAESRLAGTPRPLLGDWAKTSVGGEYRNFALTPQNRTLSVREAAELEIRRAMRIGLDGFTFDAWAGDKKARDLLDVMFDICETEKLPFELAITLDTSTMNSTDGDLVAYDGNVWEKTIKWLLDKHGDSPNLARRDGKVLIMGYQSAWPGRFAITQHVKRTMPDATAAQQKAEANRLRVTEEGWRLIADTYRKMEKNIGRPIYWEFCLNAFFEGVPNVPSGTIVKAAAFLAKEFPAMGMFLWEGPVPDIARAVLDAGAEWSHPMKLQYENFGWAQTASPGLNWLRGDWKQARTMPSTLIQQITWNDYHEATNLSPGYNTRYAYYDIMGEFIRWWKTGVEPASDRDKVYIFSHKYAAGSKMFPFRAKSRAGNFIEVVTILPAPATLRMPGRKTVDGESKWVAPAGLSYKQFPLTPGPVSVELSRRGEVSVHLKSSEPVSDRPFRQDTGKVGVSTEDRRLWAEDFGKDEPYFSYSEYGDADGDGLPNWFEMLWYGKFGSMKTATNADPNAVPLGTGKTNLQHFRDQTNPFKK